jgi:CHAT domain-containing protein/Tfp pilus assembly protein PilF
MRKAFLLSLMCILGSLCTVQHVQAQSSLHDSLRQLLTYFKDSTQDEKLKKAIIEAQSFYVDDCVDDSIATKLLTVEDLLMNATQPDLLKLLPYAQTLVVVLNEMLPQGENTAYATSLNSLALLYQKTRQYEKALPLALQDLAITKKTLGEEHLDYAVSLNNLAVLYRKMGQYEKALPLFQQALAIRKKVLGEEHPDYGTVLSNLAPLYQDMGEYEKALPLFQQALAITKKTLGEDHLDYAIGLNNLAILYQDMGQYEKALPLALQDLAIAKKQQGEEHPDYAVSLNNLAILYQDMGLFEQALPLVQQALTITKKQQGEEHPSYATGLNNLAMLYQDIGDYEKALPLFQQALIFTKKQQGEEHPSYAVSLNNLAVLYQDMGLYEKALPLAHQALAIRKKALGEEHPSYATGLNNLAMLYQDMDQYEKAFPLFQQALDIAKKQQGEEHPSYATGLNNLAMLYQDMGQYEKALPLALQDVAIMKKALGEEHPSYANDLNNLAVLYRKMGQYEKALPLFQQALAIRKKVLGEEHPDYAFSLNNLAMFYNIIGNLEDASPLLIQAANLTLKHLSRTYATLSEQEKMNFLNKNTSKFNYLPSLLIKSANQSTLAQQVYANELALKGMVLNDQKTVLSSIKKSRDSAALRLYEQWKLSKALVGKQLLLPLSQRVSYLDSLQEASNQLEQQLSRSSKVFRNQVQSQLLTAKDVSQKLAKGEAAIEFIRFPLYNQKMTDSIMYGALVLLPQDSMAKFVPLFEEKQLKHLLKRSTAAGLSQLAVDRLYSHKATGLGDSLYQLIWQPLEHFLTGVSTVYYAPAGLLHRISFMALAADPANPLAEKYRLHQVLSTRSVAVPAEASLNPKSAFAWGNIQYTLSPTAAKSNATSRTRGVSSKVWDSALSAFALYNEDTRGLRGQELPPLHSTKSEIDSLRKLFTKANILVTTLSGTKATEEAFKALDGKSPQVLHLATHGFFLPVKENTPKEINLNNSTFTGQQNPLFRSGLVFAGGNRAWKGEQPLPGKEDGILTAYEIAQMDLSGTDLVVLSACETALGDLQGNEGVIGLQRAFKMAGVKQMIVSLWKVNDRATAELMAHFYKSWLSGQSTRDALRYAQLKLKEKYSSPFYWAAFVLVE